MSINEILLHPFSLGLALGLVFLLLATIRLWGLKRELARYRRLLSDKLEADAESHVKSKREREQLARENENLKAKVHSLSQLPDRRDLRDLEVYARAEKKLTIEVPGFAQAWERAKSEAAGDLADEETGNSLPGRVFRKLFGNRPAAQTDSQPARKGLIESSEKPE